ncbi:hypothetical protein N7537_008069, partial [Penicillium hordei]
SCFNARNVKSHIRGNPIYCAINPPVNSKEPCFFHGWLGPANEFQILVNLLPAAPFLPTERSLEGTAKYAQKGITNLRLSRQNQAGKDSHAIYASRQKPSVTIIFHACDASPSSGSAFLRAKRHLRSI